MTTPVFILAGQSNAANLSDEIRDALDSRYGQGNYELLRVYDRGAPLTRERDGMDWNSPSEMRQDLMKQTIEALNADDDRSVGGVFWVQGEADTYFAAGARRYRETLETLIEEFRTTVATALSDRDTGVDDAQFTILELSNHAPKAPLRIGWETVIAEQKEVAANSAFVTALDPDTVAQAADVDALSMFRDGLHYEDGFSATLAAALVGTLNYQPPSGLLDLDGGAGDDVLLGGQNSDIIRGNAGADTLIGGDGGDDLQGGAGIDTASYETALGRVSLDLRFEGTRGDASRDTFVSIENVLGSNFDDYIYGNGVANLLDGAAGNDRLRGDAGHDTLLGGAGDDHLIGGSGRDRLDGNDGNDAMTGGAQADHIRGQAGQDQIWGGQGGDYLSGGGGDDLLFGGEARDFIYGGQDNDRLEGEQGSDRLYGQSGDDHLIGGSETDWLYGGKGRDVFVFNTGSDKDVIRDFENDDDTVLINDDLWVGTKTVQEVFNDFARTVGGDVIFDFGNGDILIVENTTYSALLNDIDFI